MIQDIEPKIMNNQYKDAKPEAGDFILCFYQDRIYVGEDQENLVFPEFSQLERECKCNELGTVSYCYLFSIDEQNYFLMLEEQELYLEHFIYLKMFGIRSCAPKEQVMAAATAYHLYVWYRDNRFCGRCAHKLEHDSKERMLKCPACRNMVFPKIAPAIIVGVTHKNKILMTRYANREYKKYALIAGFTEIGETAEQTVRREVWEEAGLHVKNIQYYKCQPWGFDSNLLLGYFAELDGDSSIEMDEEELSEAVWIKREDIEKDESHLSLTHEMIMFFKDAEAFFEFRK